MGATYETGARLINAARAAVVVAALLALGCGNDPPPVVAADAGESEASVGSGKSGKPKSDGSLSGPVPVAPLDLMQKLPRHPKGWRAIPGDAAEVLLKLKSLKPSPYTDAILVERPTDSAFRMIHYQLDKGRKRVTAVVGTFHAAYLVPERKAAIEEAAAQRLGKHTKLRSPYYTGRVWRTLDYRIELRRGKKAGDLELVYHHRGAADPDDIPPP